MLSKKIFDDIIIVLKTGGIIMNRIKQLRIKSGLTQTGLGKLLNVKEAAISKYENEKIPLTAETLIKLKYIFGVSIDYILCVSDISDNNPDSKSKNPSIPLKENSFDTVIECFTKLSENGQEKALEYMQMLKEHEEINSK